MEEVRGIGSQEAALRVNVSESLLARAIALGGRNIDGKQDGRARMFILLRTLLLMRSYA